MRSIFLICLAGVVVGLFGCAAFRRGPEVTRTTVKVDGFTIELVTRKLDDSTYKVEVYSVGALRPNDDLLAYVLSKKAEKIAGRRPYKMQTKVGEWVLDKSISIEEPGPKDSGKMLVGLVGLE